MANLLESLHACGHDSLLAGMIIVALEERLQVRVLFALETLQVLLRCVGYMSFSPEHDLRWRSFIEGQGQVQLLRTSEIYACSNISVL